MGLSQEAITGLYTHESAKLQRYLTRRVGILEDAEDLVQDAYMRMLAAPVEAESLRSPKAFLFAVASNLAIDSIRRKRRERIAVGAMNGPETVLNGDQIDLICPTPNPEQQVDHLIQINQVVAGLEGLSRKCRVAFLMHKFMDMPYSEVARALGVTVSMVEKYLSQALRQVRAVPA